MPAGEIPRLYDEGNEGYKEKDRKNNTWREFSLSNEIPNIHILFENVIFGEFGGNAWD